MKKIAGLLLAIAMAAPAIAQQTAKQKHMVITITDQEAAITFGKSNNVIITRNDTTQVQQYVKLKNKTADREAQMMEIIEPYYDNGWKLVSTSAEAVPGTTLPTEVFRYYFTKKD